MERRSLGVRKAPRRPRVRVLLAAIIALLAATTVQPCRAQSAAGDSTTAVAPPPAIPAAAVAPAAAAPTSAASPVPLPRVGGYVQAREFMQKDVGLTALLNRVRFSITGALPARFS